MKRTTLAAAAATFACLFGAGTAQAAPSTTCTFDPATGLAHLQLHTSPSGQLERDGNLIRWFDAFGQGTCTAPNGQAATIANTNQIIFGGRFNTTDQFLISKGAGWSNSKTFKQIPITVGSGPEDVVDVLGTEDRDFIAVTGGRGTGKQGGILLDGFATEEPTIKLANDPSVVRLFGRGGGDWLGYPYMTTPTILHLDLRGGAGDDLLNGGLLGNDLLQGDEGNDTFKSDEGQAGDVLDGGIGSDYARADDNDKPISIETFNPPGVGTLDFKQTRAAKATRLQFGWQHPQSWKRLRSLKLIALDGGRETGSITIDPHTGTAKAKGTLALVGRATIAHKGKWARADLRVRPAAGQAQLLDIVATDVEGKRQRDRMIGELMR